MKFTISLELFSKDYAISKLFHGLKLTRSAADLNYCQRLVLNTCNDPKKKMKITRLHLDGESSADIQTLNENSKV